MQSLQLPRNLCLAIALCVALAQPAAAQEAASESPDQPPPAPIEAPPAAPVEEIRPAPAEEPGRLPLEASVARVFSGGRVGAGALLPGGQEVLCLLSTVRLGEPIAVRLGGTHSTAARIVASSRQLDLAILALENHAEPGAARSLSASLPESGDEVRIVGHGGSTRSDDEDLVVSGLASFSSLWARVASAHGETAGGEAPMFLLDRSAGPEDLGAPVFDGNGEIVGIITELLEDAGGRALALATPAIGAFVAAERSEAKYRRPHHLQSWGGFGIAAHNRPSHLAGLVTLGFRAVLFDRLRIEPWFETVLGTRAPLTEEDTSAQSRPRELWWSLETGLHLGYRVPLFGEGGRNYFVPHVGFRLGWNRFQHRTEEITSLCGKGGMNCSHSLERSIDRELSFRGGFELGADLRHGGIRIGYRLFLDPRNLKAHSMHRLVLTFDGAPLPIRVGDSN